MKGGDVAKRSLEFAAPVLEIAAKQPSSSEPLAHSRFPVLTSPVCLHAGPTHVPAHGVLVLGFGLWLSDFLVPAAAFRAAFALALRRFWYALRLFTFLR
jgi:hypothetical protein